MRSRKTGALPSRLAALRRRFERWRRTRRGHSRIPEPLWTSAVKLAGMYGLCRTARALRLDYNALKRRVESSSPHDASEPDPAMRFVEWVSPERGGVPVCIVELEDPGGAKMRVHLRGTEAPDLAALSRSFWSVQA